MLWVNAYQTAVMISQNSSKDKLIAKTSQFNISLHTKRIIMKPQTSFPAMTFMMNIKTKAGTFLSFSNTSNDFIRSNAWMHQICDGLIFGNFCDLPFLSQALIFFIVSDTVVFYP